MQRTSSRTSNLKMHAMPRLSRFARFPSPLCCSHHQHRRLFHTSSPRFTYGVFAALTEMRVKTPWVQALREWDEGLGGDGHPKNDALAFRDLSPKRMSESYHSQASFSIWRSSCCVKLTDADLDTSLGTRSLDARQLSECEWAS